MRAFQRKVYSYWYATMEDREAAMIEAADAAMTINILDEAIFLDAMGQAYGGHRANDRLGRVVMGLELIRNCETYSPIAFRDAVQGRVVVEALFGAINFLEHIEPRRTERRSAGWGPDDAHFKEAVRNGTRACPPPNGRSFTASSTTPAS